MSTHLQLPLCHESDGCGWQRQENAEQAHVCHIALLQQEEFIHYAAQLYKHHLQQKQQNTQLGPSLDAGPHAVIPGMTRAMHTTGCSRWQTRHFVLSLRRYWP